MPERVLPETINIMGAEYRVVECETQEEALRGAPTYALGKTEWVWGSANPAIAGDVGHRAIYVYMPDRTPADVFQTFIHEIIHLVAIEGSIEPVASWCSAQHKDHHALAALATGLADTLVRNGLVKL